ncbi:MAG TPA: TCR/Tet family MFS transporter [Candidatus Krumholzibacteria bacterium]
MTEPAPRKSSVLFVFVVVLIDVIGFGLIIPVVPRLVMHLTGEGLSRAAIYGGWLWFAYAVMQFFSAPVMGGISDRLGRRPVLLAALAALGCDYLIMAFAPTITWLFVGRTLAGIAGASFIPAYAYLADITPPEKRAQNFGIVGAAFGLGFIIGPALGGLLGRFGEHTPFFFAAGLAFANVTWGFFALPESLPKESRRHFDLRRANPMGSLMHIRKYHLVPTVAASIFFWQLAQQTFSSTWTYFTMFRFHWSEAAVGGSLAFVGMMMAISQGGLTRVVIPRIRERRTAAIGMLVGAAAYTGFAFASSGWMMYAWMVCWLFAGMVYPSLNAIMSQQVPANAQGELQGAVASLYSLASVLGPPLMTHLFGRFSSPESHIQFPGAAFLCSALLVVTSGILFFIAIRRAPAPAIAKESAPATGH